MFKKNLVFILIISIALQTLGVVFFIPKKASSAALPVAVVASSPAQMAQQSAAHVAAETTIKKGIEKVLKILLEAARKKLLDYFVDSIIKWIQGTDSEPAFITDWQEFLTKVVDDAVGEFINTTDFSFLCSNFRYQIELDLAEPANINPATCTLSEVVENIEDFYDDFSNGGWLAFNTQTYTWNNYYGSYLTLWETEYLTAAQASEAAENEALSSQGFSGTKKCQSSLLDPATGKFQCIDWEITTPGGTIADTIQDALMIDIDTIISADEVETYLAAILDAAISRLFRAGANGLLGLLTPNAPEDLGYQGPSGIKYSCDKDVYACIVDVNNGTYETAADCQAECVADELEMPTCNICNGGMYVRGRVGGGDSCSGDGTCPICTGFQPADACVAFCVNTKENTWNDDGTVFSKQDIIDSGYQEMFTYFNATIPEEGCTCSRSMYSDKGNFGGGYTDDSSYCRNCILLPNGFSACTVSDWCNNNCYTE